ncbi:1-deoxy-D-xylulose-5-phosphate reductoisomerase [Adhaeretor mobilis]|uniref:1-deoxy-D-xylulose 5-phosphate reductoisomerase n=1 Tax=Adhaeretor mobilis TaxID=1930276 RepID=A0A517MQT9_9BACT|nr:1-deoxy-D-xylulose-5-phosphate reductoisomerase [Adhaeretor mobilis]QDS97250.1 1-deoxy-D-xylulose 5-phosphate reductoisomerase [Adhaeretor mobilis]
MAAAKQIAVFGSTGSIGVNALDVIASSGSANGTSGNSPGGSGQQLAAIALSAHSQCDLLLKQAQQHRPRWVIVTDPAAAKQFDWQYLPVDCELLIGPEALNQIAAERDVDVVLAAIVGSAGLESTWSALANGKTVALANKETLVMAGELIMQLAEKNGGKIVPVDSEHSALFQALHAGKPSEVEKLIITGSGGPFRHTTPMELQQVTVAEALNHPTWNMGPKNTVDSATLMNKALEIIEARWLFDVPAEKISVAIHPQSVVHSMVEFIDGSILAQLSPPDMRMPIQYALNYPDRVPGVAKRLDWTQAFQLEFEPPNPERFPALQLGADCAAKGGTCGAVLSAANEAAVGGFLEGELHFTEIVPACRSILGAHNFEPNPSLETLVELDRWSREEVSRWVCA